jgi:hypothetical protein
MSVAGVLSDGISLAGSNGMHIICKSMHFPWSRQPSLLVALFRDEWRVTSEAGAGHHQQAARSLKDGRDIAALKLVV